MSQVARVGRRRYLRRSRYARFRATPGGFPRSEGLVDFWAREGTRLTSSATGDTFTADNTSEELTAASHGLTTGDGPFLVSTDGVLPTGLTAGVLYWVSVVDEDTLQLHIGKREAVSGTPVAFTTDGTGTHTLTRAATTEALYHLNRSNKPSTIAAASDIDTLN